MKQSDVLYAIYDLAVAPTTFDIVGFLILSEIERKKAGCISLHVVIVPGPDEGFRQNSIKEYSRGGARNYDADTLRWRLRNILVPSCWMIPSSQTVTVCASREEAQSIETSVAEHIFPKQYKVSSPVENYSLKLIIDAASQEVFLPSIQVTPQSLRFLSEWIRTNVGERKLITITLRECFYEHGRNSVSENWGSFAKSLDPTVYCPVVIRDIDSTFKPVPPELKGILIFPEIVWNLELRAALYELSYLNMFVSNGPDTLCRYNRRSRFIIFKLIAPSLGAASEQYLRLCGLEPGAQYRWSTPFQQLVWEDDRLEVIQKAFKEMCDRIESFSTATLPDLVNFFNEMLNKNDLNNAEWVSSLLTDRFKDNHVAWHVRAIALRLTNEPKEALSAIERSLRLHAAPDSLAELIRIYQALGLHDKADQLSKDIAKAQELKQPLTLQF